MVALNGIVEDTFVAWNWKAGTCWYLVSTTGSQELLKVILRFSEHAAAGFSIIGYGGNGTAGHTIPHNLGQLHLIAIIVKNRSAAWNWSVYHKDWQVTSQAAPGCRYIIQLTQVLMLK